MNSLYKKIHYKMNELNNLERSILKYCMNNINEVTNLTAEQLSKKTFVSQATISRMAKKLGFRGFQEFKFAATDYIKYERKLFQEDGSVDFNQLVHKIVKQLSDSLYSLKESQVKEIIQLIDQAETVEFFGVGGSLPTCIAAARKLTFLGKKSNARIDWDELTAVSQHLTNNDLAFVVSHSGETVGILGYADKLHDNQVPIVAIVGAPNSTLESLADFTIYADMSSVYYDDVDLSSRIALNGILDVLMIQYAETYVKG